MLVVAQPLAVPAAVFVVADIPSAAVRVPPPFVPPVAVRADDAPPHDDDAHALEPGKPFPALGVGIRAAVCAAVPAAFAGVPLPECAAAEDRLQLVEGQTLGNAGVGDEEDGAVVGGGVALKARDCHDECAVWDRIGAAGGADVGAVHVGSDGVRQGCG